MKLNSMLKLAVMSLTSASSNQSIVSQRGCIVLSADGDMVIMPVVPANLPEIGVPQNNEVFKSVVGDMSVIGTIGLRALKLEGLLPSSTSKYSWAYPKASDAADIINFINDKRSNYIPFRITITSGSDCYLNMQVLANSFSYYSDSVKDYHYSLELTEYRVRNPLTGGLQS